MWFSYLNFTKKRQLWLRVVIYEDKSQFREGLTMLINGSDGFFSVLQAYRIVTTFAEEVEKWSRCSLDDINMPRYRIGLEGFKELREVDAEVKVLDGQPSFDDNKM